MKSLAAIILSVFGMLIFVAFFLDFSPGAPRPMRVNIDTGNFYRYINLTMTGNAQSGTRIHFFPERQNTTFENVVITYSIFPTVNGIQEIQNATMLDANGNGQSSPCLQVFPRIVSVVGAVITQRN